MNISRRNFLRRPVLWRAALWFPRPWHKYPLRPIRRGGASPSSGKADYTIRIAATPVEIAPNKIISLTTYNGQFPGPLLRFKEGQKLFWTW